MYKTFNKIAKNSLILIFGSLINQFLVLIVGLASANYLGPEFYGILALSGSINIIFIFIIELGLHNYVTREVALDQSLDQYFLSRIIALKAIMSLILIILIFLLLKLLNYSLIIIEITLITTFAYILNSYVFSIYSIIQAKEEMKYISSGYILQGFFIFIGTSMAIINNYNIYVFAIVPLIANGIILAYALFLVKLKYNLTIFKFSIDKKFVIHLRKAIPFGITSILVLIYLWSNSIWISLFHGEELLGIFNIAVKLFFATFIISQGINMTIYPILTTEDKKSNNSLEKIYTNLIKSMLVISMLLTTVLIIFAPVLIKFLLNPVFNRSILVLQIISLSLPFIFVRGVFERYLDISKNQHLVTISYAIGVIVNLFLNAIFIYFFEIEGAAYSLVVTDIVIFSLTFYYYKKLKSKRNH